MHLGGPRGATQTDEIPLGHWWAYEERDANRKRFVCFEYGRERARPACRYFAIDTLSDERGHVYHQLGLGWVGERYQVVERLRERMP